MRSPQSRVTQRENSNKKNTREKTQPANADAEALAAKILERHHQTFGGTRRALTNTMIKDADALLRLGPGGAATQRSIALTEALAMVEFVFTRLATPNRGGFCWAKQIQSAGNLRKHWTRMETEGESALSAHEILVRKLANQRTPTQTTATYARTVIDIDPKDTP